MAYWELAQPMHERARHWNHTARAGSRTKASEKCVNTWSLFPINLGLPGLSRSCKAFDKGLDVIFRLLFRADFARKLVEVLSQLLISADSYRSYWALEPVKSKVERMPLGVKGLNCDCCSGLIGAPLGPKHKFFFFLLLQPKTFKPRSLHVIRTEMCYNEICSPSYLEIN